MYDVVIIGAGVIGCAVARELSRLALRVLVLDKASDIAEGATKANSGIVHAGFDALPNSSKATYNRRGNPLVYQWAHELSVPCRNNTSLVLALEQNQLDGLQRLMQRGRDNGITGLHLLSPEQVLQREKTVNPAVAGALLAETGGIVSPYGLAIALAEQAAVNGVEFRLDCEVTGLLNRPQPEAFSDRARFELTTSAGSVRTRALVNAAGLFADEINNAVSQDRFTISARRGEYWMLDKTVGAQFSASLFQVPTEKGKGVLVTPTVEQTLIIGPTHEEIEDKSDTRTTAAKLAEIQRVAERSCPNLPRDRSITTFSGLRAHCDRGDFLVGRSADVRGLYLAAGIESPGLTAAPAIALDLAAWIADDLDAQPRRSFLPPPPPILSIADESLESYAQFIARDPAFGRIVCRCEQVSEAQIRTAIRRPLGARTLDGIKRRTRANMGRCQGSFCTPRVLEILAEELDVPVTQITKFGGQSRILVNDLKTSQMEALHWADST
jgi:glycerol-3-phosphate dehydrogenase